jgi:hypothetical protein
MQFQFVTVIPRHLKFVFFRRIIKWPYIMILFCILVKRCKGVLCYLLLILDPFKLLLLFCKLWLRIIFVHVSETITFLAPQTRVIRSSFVWWIPQGTYTFHLREDWGRASLCNARHLSHYDEYLSKCSLEIIILTTENCNYLIIIQETLDSLEKTVHWNKSRLIA